MPTIELLAEIELLKKQLAETEAAARMYCERTVKAESRLEALKKDARWMAEYTLVLRSDHSEAIVVANRIIESTEEVE